MEKSMRQILSKYKWTITGFIGVFILCLLFITVGFWVTVLIIVLCLIGSFFGYLKDTNLKFSTFISKLNKEWRD